MPGGEPAQTTPGPPNSRSPLVGSHSSQGGWSPTGPNYESTLGIISGTTPVLDEDLVYAHSRIKRIFKNPSVVALSLVGRQLQMRFCFPRSAKWCSPTCPRRVSGDSFCPSRAAKLVHLAAALTYAPPGVNTRARSLRCTNLGSAPRCTDSGGAHTSMQTRGAAPRCAKPGAHALVNALRCAHRAGQVNPTTLRTTGLDREPPNSGRHSASTNSPPPKIWSNRTPCNAGSARCSCCRCASGSLPGYST